MLPNDTTANVPTNTRIWFVSAAPLFGSLDTCDVAPRLLDDSGMEIPTTLSVVDHFAVLTPAQLLEPMEYTVEAGCLVGPGNLYEPTSTFVVPDDATEDLVPPERPDMGVGEPDVTRSEAGHDIVAINIEGEFEDILVVDIGDVATLDADALTGEVSSLHLVEDFWLSSADCAIPRSDIAAGTTTSFAFASFDLAGNFSGWTEAEPVTIDQTEQSCQCSSSGGRPPLHWALLGLLGLVVRRRRR